MGCEDGIPAMIGAGSVAWRFGWVGGQTAWKKSGRCGEIDSRWHGFLWLVGVHGGWVGWIGLDSADGRGRGKKGQRAYSLYILD